MSRMSLAHGAGAMGTDPQLGCGETGGLRACPFLVARGRSPYTLSLSGHLAHINLLIDTSVIFTAVQVRFIRNGRADDGPAASHASCRADVHPGGRLCLLLALRVARL